MESTRSSAIVSPDTPGEHVKQVRNRKTFTALTVSYFIYFLILSTFTENMFAHKLIVL